MELELKELFDLYLVLIQNQSFVDSISCDNPISWFVPLQFLAVFFVFFELKNVFFARKSVGVVYAVVVSVSFEFRMPLFFSFVQTRFPTISGCLQWPFFATFILGRTSRTIDIGFTKIWHAPF